MTQTQHKKTFLGRTPASWYFWFWETAPKVTEQPFHFNFSRSHACIFFILLKSHPPSPAITPAVSLEQSILIGFSSWNRVRSGGNAKQASVTGTAPLDSPGWPCWPSISQPRTVPYPTAAIKISFARVLLMASCWGDLDTTPVLPASCNGTQPLSGSSSRRNKRRTQQSTQQDPALKELPWIKSSMINHVPSMHVYSQHSFSGGALCGWGSTDKFWVFSSLTW